MAAIDVPSVTLPDSENHFPSLEPGDCDMIPGPLEKEAEKALSADVYATIDAVRREIELLKAASNRLNATLYGLCQPTDQAGTK